MVKQINIDAEVKDIQVFFNETNVSSYLENCYKIALDKNEITSSNMSYWEINGFTLVGVAACVDTLVITVNVNQRRINRGVVKSELVIQ
jgi:hypothetical protein